MKTEILLVFVLILKVAVCFELTETFGKQTIEDGPYGGGWIMFFNATVSIYSKGSGGSPWTDGGEVHLNGMISSMEIRKAVTPSQYWSTLNF